MPIEEYLVPVGSQYLEGKPPLDYSEMRGWSKMEVKQFDSAQSLFPSTAEYTANGSAYSVYDFIHEAVNYLSPKYSDREKSAICEGIGRYYEHLIVDLGAPAPCKWEDIKADFYLREKTSQFLKVFAKIAYSKTRNSYPLDTKKSIRDSCQALIQPKPSFQNINFTAGPSYRTPMAPTSSPDVWQFDSPVASPVANPFSPSPSPLTISSDWGKKLWNLAAPAITNTPSLRGGTQFLAGESARLLLLDATSSTTHGDVWNKLDKGQPSSDKTEEPMDKKKEMVQDAAKKCAGADFGHPDETVAFFPAPEQFARMMQKIRNLEITLESIEACCIKKSALIARINLPSYCHTPIAPKNALFNPDIASYTPVELLEYFESSIKQLELDVASAQLLLEQKCTQLALLESGSDALRIYSNARKVAREVMELRVQKLELQTSYKERSDSLVDQSNHDVLTHGDDTRLEYTSTKRAVISEQVTKSIYNSICMEGPVRWKLEKASTECSG